MAQILSMVRFDGTYCLQVEVCRHILLVWEVLVAQIGDGDIKWHRFLEEEIFFVSQVVGMERFDTMYIWQGKFGGTYCWRAMVWWQILLIW